MKTLLLAAAAALLAQPAAAAIHQVTPGVDGTFVEVLPQPNPAGAGVYGVENRGGDGGAAATWEVGVGRGTSQGGNFNQANFNWGASPTAHAFSLTWGASGLSFTLDGVTTVSYAAAPLIGDTLKIYAKRAGSAYLATLDGQAIGVTVPSNTELFFWSDNNWGGNGFTATGTITLLNGGGSSSEVMFKHGTFTPNAVPEPAAWALMILGFGAIGAMARRDRRQTAAA